MSLSKQIAEAKGWERVGQLNTGEWVGEEKATRLAWDELPPLPEWETNKSQAMDLLIELVDAGYLPDKSTKGEYFFSKDDVPCFPEDKDPLTAICKAWLSAFGGGYDLLE